jgi:hypothetical protein
MCSLTYVQMCNIIKINCSGVSTSIPPSIPPFFPYSYPFLTHSNSSSFPPSFESHCRTERYVQCTQHRSHVHCNRDKKTTTPHNTTPHRSAPSNTSSYIVAYYMSSLQRVTFPSLLTLTPHSSPSPSLTPSVSRQLYGSYSRTVSFSPLSGANGPAPIEGGYA